MSAKGFGVYYGLERGNVGMKWYRREGADRQISHVSLPFIQRAPGTHLESNKLGVLLIVPRGNGLHKELWGASVRGKDLLWGLGFE